MSTTAADLWRMADRAREQGLSLDRVARVWFHADSVSRPGLRHVVYLGAGPMHGCDCEGYQGYGHCKHYAAALSANGWLPDPDDPGPAGPPAAKRPRRDETDAERDARRERLAAAGGRLDTAAAGLAVERARDRAALEAAGERARAERRAEGTRKAAATRAAKKAAAAVGGTLIAGSELAAARAELLPDPWTLAEEVREAAGL